MIKIERDTVITISSVAIALAALFIAVWQGFETRKHNRLSLTPKLDLVREDRKEAEIIGIFMESKGLGPAKVKDIVISIGEKRYDINQLEGMMDVLNRLDINKTWIQYYLYGEGHFLPVDSKRYILIGADRDRVRAETEHKLQRALSKVKVHIEYESVYGDKYEVEGDWKKW